MIKKLGNAVKNWWLLLIIGIISVICGISVFATPASGVATMAIILTINLIAGGIGSIAYVISNRENIPSWGWSLIPGILTLIAGIILACNPAGALVFIVYIFAVGALAKSISTICQAISLSKIEGSKWGWTLVLGILGLLCSFYLFAHPLFTGLYVGIMVGVALLFMGIQSIIVSIQLSKVKGAVKDLKD